MMHDNTPPAEILVRGSMCDDYDPVVAKAFLERLRPENCMIMVVDSDLKQDTPDEWKLEPLYGATYRESEISSERMEKWENPVEIDPKLHVPALNEYITTDFSLRCDDDGAKMSESERKQSQKENPQLLHKRANFRMWHKMDRFWRVPKSNILLSIVSPKTYESPRTMTLSRMYQRVLNDDLNSFVYDASLAGCNYRYVFLSELRLSLPHTASNPSCICLQQRQLFSYWI
jgi:secreted Zn-dependent insulinase-like peptidase